MTREYYRERDFDRLTSEMFDEEGAAEIRLTRDDVQTLRKRVPVGRRLRQAYRSLKKEAGDDV